MRIGELARRTGLPTSRIRFYERIGLLKDVERLANGYRDYPEDAILVLRMIAAAQKAGFSLDELRVMLPDGRSAWGHDDLIGSLRRKVRHIEKLQVQLAESRAHLLELLTQIEAKPAGIDCTENARRVLSDLKLGGEPGRQPRIVRASRPALDE